MPITELLERNANLYGDEVALVEINPQIPETRRVTWKEYDLIEPEGTTYYRREITWSVFNEKANRFANLLLSRGVKKGDKVAILMMNCLEWLPIYFGILKTGALAVPLNFGMLRMRSSTVWIWRMSISWSSDRSSSAVWKASLTRSANIVCFISLETAAPASQKTI